MSKLYKAIVEVPIVVIADSEREAASEITYYLSSECENILSEEIDVYELNNLSDIPDDWSKDCVPYNNDDDLTIEEFLNKEQE